MAPTCTRTAGRGPGHDKSHVLSATILENIAFVILLAIVRLLDDPFFFMLVCYFIVGITSVAYSYYSILYIIVFIQSYDDDDYY